MSTAERVLQIALPWLDPRRSLASAIGWMLAVLAVVGAIVASTWVGNLARHRLEAQTGALYRQYAVQISNVLDNNLYNRQQWVAGLARVFAPGMPVVEQRSFLERVRQSLPEVEWVGFVDLNGRVRAASGGALEGSDVTHTNWFIAGRREAFIGQARVGDSLEGAPVTAERSGLHHVLELSAPVRDSQGNLVGVMAAFLSWEWAARLESTLSEGLKTGRPIETLMLGRDGIVLFGPGALPGTRPAMPTGFKPGAAGQFVARWSDGIDYLSGYSVSDGVDAFPGLGWTIVVRESAVSAFADAEAFSRHLFVVLLVLGLMGAAVGIVITNRLTRGLASIARAADDIRQGNTASLTVPDGLDEAARISHSLALLLDDLARERASLKSLNAELDARVMARTRQIERMSDENKYAAVVRERLRMARDLHDTLAHSMMALLTEIRLLRKLSETNPARLADELANAEAVARQGLEEARVAITALRFNAVRDIGLGPAIRQLLERCEERLGIPVSFRSDAVVETLADARAENVYRIVEEALHNVGRHARATRVAVEVDVAVAANAAAGAADGHGDVLVVAINDDGIGFDPGLTPPGHYGLAGMREQAELIGARVTIASAPGRGTSVAVTMTL